MHVVCLSKLLLCDEVMVMGVILFCSPDGKYLVSLGGPCRVWDVTSSTVVTALPKENVSK